ncbi:MAG: putative lipid II flippase FtsW [Candidatus Nitrotoga sp.]|jgi:cell division protein FtsW|nr:putative lipid II flippase FtsW [Candidatus Nitrotoga sp.]
MTTTNLIGRHQVLEKYDEVLLWITIALLVFGLVMVYSASLATAAASKFTGFQPAYYLIRHGLFIFIGVAAGVAAFQVSLQNWQKLAPYLFFLGVVLLVLVLIPGIGHSVNGSRRWISLFSINLQPSEFIKLFAVLYAADYTVRKSLIKNRLSQEFLPMFAVMALVGFLLLQEPDMGAFVVICMVAMCILFLGGFNIKVFIMLVFALPIAFSALIIFSPYRMQRVIGFMDPWSDPLGKGYQLSHALIAFGRGEWFGVGLGGGLEKLFYLPEAHTDFLLAVIAEELGFMGVLVVILLFAGLIVRAFAIGRQASTLDRQFAALVAQGIAVWLGFQAMINIGVNTGILPTKGLTLPFLSFGGSSVVVSCIAAALLLRVDWENRRAMKGLPV